MTKETPLADGDARQRIRTDLDTTFVVEAAAGTGKTTELIARMVAVIATGQGTLDRMVAVTFTDMAAGEMKLRLRTELERARGSGSSGQDDRFDQALAALETAHIGTIHSFCSDLLHERPVEAGVDPAFAVMADQESNRLLERAFDGWFPHALADPPEGLRRLLARSGRAGAGRARPGGSADGPRSELLRACGSLVDRRDFDAPWRRDPFERDQRIDGLVEQVKALGQRVAQANNGRDKLVGALREHERFSVELADRERVRSRDYDGLEAALRELLGNGRAWQYKGRGKWFADGVLKTDVLAQRDELEAGLERFRDDADADLAACLQRELGPVVAAYEQLKHKAGALDFLDLLIFTRDLVRDQPGVRRELQRRFSHLFVDEFQDTDPLQAELLLLLAGDDAEGPGGSEAAGPAAGKLFVVGDPKQSLYRFRRADMALYQRIKQQLLSQGAELLHLTTSFRSLPAVQAAVNVGFAPAMAGGGADGCQAEYVPLEQHRPARASQPAVVALPVPQPYGVWGRVTKKAVQESAPDAVGAFIAWLVRQSGWTVLERGAEVPVASRHVCLLFRHFQGFGQDLTRPYVRALENRRLAHVLVGGRSFHTREEVLAMRTALEAIEWPDDELSVYGTLRGPLLSIADEALLEYRHGVGSLHPLRPLDDAAQAALSEAQLQVWDALELVGRLHVGRNRRPVAETITRLLDATRAHAAIAIWPTGEQALANLQRLVELARRFERHGATSFRSFLEWLEDQAARGQGSEAPIVEEGTDGVRVMTVHKAKGLEFPIVVLCEPGSPSKARYPSRYVDNERRLWAFSLVQCAPRELTEHRAEVLEHDDAEIVRVAYVAATRARDLLVVPAVGDERLDGWVKPLHTALYPEQSERRSFSPAPGCPPFGDDSVLSRSARCDATPEESVAPGYHPMPGAADHGVVWWDPKVLELDVPPVGGLRQTDLLAAGEEHETVAAAGIAAHQAWADEAVVLSRAAGEPTMVAWPVTTVAHGTDDAAESLAVPACEVDIHSTATDRTARPAGSRFGTLVHAVLAEVDFAVVDASLQAIAHGQGRLVGATEAEIAAAIEAVRAALTHPLIVAAAASSDCRRETPVCLPMGEAGVLVEGVVDLAFVEQTDQGPRWTVVDFKTDVADELPAAYATQIHWYVHAIAAATGAPARGAILRV